MKTIRTLTTFLTLNLFTCATLTPDQKTALRADGKAILAIAIEKGLEYATQHPSH